MEGRGDSRQRDYARNLDVLTSKWSRQAPYTFFSLLQHVSRVGETSNSCYEYDMLRQARTKLVWSHWLRAALKGALPPCSRGPKASVTAEAGPDRPAATTAGTVRYTNCTPRRRKKIRCPSLSPCHHAPARWGIAPAGTTGVWPHERYVGWFRRESLAVDAESSCRMLCPQGCLSSLVSSAGVRMLVWRQMSPWKT